MLVITDFDVGDVVQDCVTGYKGVILGARVFVGESVAYGVQSRELEDGETLPMEWLYSERLTLLSKKRFNLGKSEKFRGRDYGKRTSE